MPNITGSNVTVMVRNMDRAVDFYQQLGLTLQQRWDNHYAMLTAPDLTIGLHPSDEEENGSGTTSIGFFVDNIDEARSNLERLHVSFRDENGKSGHYLNFQDPDGTHLYYVLPAW